MTNPAFALAGSFSIGLIAGLGAGLIHFALLWWNTRLFLTGGAVKAVVMHFARFAVTGAVLLALAKLGAAALLGGGTGFLLARGPLLRHFREER